MALNPGQTLLHYEITEQIGEGGMGVVWKALDTTLQRDVAIKVLPDDVAANPDRLARFEREAKVLASLNHPNIAAIHGLHQDAGNHFLVLELVEGEDLAARMSRGAINLHGHSREGNAYQAKQIRCINQAKRGMLAMSLGWIGTG